MKTMLSRLLALLGLASAQRCKALSRQVDQLRMATREWKQKAGAASAKAQSLETDLRRQTHLLQKLGKSTAALESRHDEVARLRERLVEAEREFAVARESLMAVEVKLDILEGAANVLDARTRLAIAPVSQPSERHA